MEFRKLDSARLDKGWMQEMVEATKCFYKIAIASVLSLLVFVDIVFIASMITEWQGCNAGNNVLYEWLMPSVMIE